MRTRLAAAALLVPLLCGASWAEKAARPPGQSRWALVRAAKKVVDIATNRKVAVHLANFSSRATLTALSLDAHGVGIAMGATDGTVASAGFARQLKEKPLKEILKDPVTETLGSIGFTGVGNAFRMANMPIAAEISFGAAALLGGHGLKSGIDAANKDLGSPKLTFRQRLVNIAKNPFAAGAHFMKVLKDPRVGLAGANAFMKVSLMAQTAGQHELAAGLAGIGITLGVIPVASQIHGDNLKEIAHSTWTVLKSPMAVTTSALVLTDLGLMFGALDMKQASTITLGGALTMAGTSAFKAVRDQVKNQDGDAAAQNQHLDIDVKQAAGAH